MFPTYYLSIISSHDNLDRKVNLVSFQGDLKDASDRLLDSRLSTVDGRLPHLTPFFDNHATIAGISLME